MSQFEYARPASRWLTRLSVAVVLIILIGILLLPATRSAGGAAKRVHCLNNLKQIGLALENYRAAHGVYPPAYTVNGDGERLHSWRTFILPYLDDRRYVELYASLDLTKPWNDPVNLVADDLMPLPYACPSFDLKGETTYLAVVSDESLLRPTSPRSSKEVTRPLREILVIAEVDRTQSVAWMSPYDTDPRATNDARFEPKPKQAPHGSVRNALFADCSCRTLDHAAPLVDHVSVTYIK